MKTRTSLAQAFGLALLAVALSDATAQERPQLLPNRPGSGPATSLSSAPRENTNTTTKSVPPGAYVSPWLMDVIRLAQSRIDDSIILTFIDSAGTFNLDPDQIIYLRDLGVSAEVITTLIQHDLEITSGLRQMPTSPSASPPAIHWNFAHSESPEKLQPTVSPASTPAPTAAPVAAQDSSSPLVSENSRPEDLTISPDDLANVPRRLGCQRQSVLPRQVVSPVRQPYPVQLIDPIIMVRGQGRTPNLVVIELRP
jgi:hypothetical protein